MTHEKQPIIKKNKEHVAHDQTKKIQNDRYLDGVSTQIYDLNTKIKLS